MKKSYIILIIVFICLISSLFFIPKKPKEQLYMQTLIEQTYSYEQFDSLCNADNIYNDLNEWDCIYFTNDSSNSYIKQYLYTIYKDDTLIVYSIIPSEDSIFINKRITIEQ